MLNSYTAVSHHVPVLFLSGDEEICRQAKELIQALRQWKRSMVSVRQRGARRKKSDFRNPRRGKGSYRTEKECQVALPSTLRMRVTYKDWKKVHDVVLSGNAEGRYLHK